MVELSLPWPGMRRSASEPVPRVGGTGTGGSGATQTMAGQSVCPAKRSRVDGGARLVVPWPTVRKLRVDATDGRAIEHRVDPASEGASPQEKLNYSENPPGCSWRYWS